MPSSIQADIHDVDNDEPSGYSYKYGDNVPLNVSLKLGAHLPK